MLAREENTLNRIKQALSKFLSSLRPKPTLRIEFKDKQMWDQAGSTRRGRTLLSDKIAATGARPGELVQIDEHGHARVVGRKPSMIIYNTK